MIKTSLFGQMTDTSSLPTLKLVDAPLAASNDKLAWERELLGLYISGHPLEQYRAVIEKRDMNIEKSKTLADGKEVIVAGIIEELRPVNTKKGDPMMFLRMADFTGSIECVVFPRVLFEYRNSIAVDKCVAIKGKISERNGEKSLIIDKVKEL